MPRKKKPKDHNTGYRLSYQKEADKYRELDGFYQMCKRGEYDPFTALQHLAPYLNTPLGAGLAAAARDLQKYWKPSFAPAKVESPEGEGGPAFIIIDPVTAGPNQHYKWEQYFLDRGWTMPAGYQRAVPNPFEAGAPKRTAEVDRAALIAKLKKPEPEDGGEASGK